MSAIQTSNEVDCADWQGQVFDADKGFGFIAEDDGADVFLHANALPEGVTTLKKGHASSSASSRAARGRRALQVRVLDLAPSLVSKRERDAGR